ncbi:uncharacterized protein cd34 isoform X1 [Gasterosteus aculeatus]|uniref:uncharacterized protein si:dkey-261h17.1 isoform X2 n=1 Tax=Gasterosteus aculeatus aculeatus TaxID=481459 RepID=UPI001A998775|nr:uncharacterized protein si:dkey-261h17.1 isoform X2 [Gasterosteus aculeatus aculeatus]
MNGPWRRMAGALVLCALMLRAEVMCEDRNATTATTNTTGTYAITSSAPVIEKSATSPSPLNDNNTSITTNPTGAPDGKAGQVMYDGKETPQKHMTTATLTTNDSKEKKSRTSDSSVFVGILVSGLLAALAIVVGYFKCQRRTGTKGLTMAESCPVVVEQDNQGNTLLSVAPLNPLPETLEKPSVNGEAPEEDKTQPPPPTNGHSATKTADTEM